MGDLRIQLMEVRKLVPYFWPYELWGYSLKHMAIEVMKELKGSIRVMQIG